MVHAIRLSQTGGPEVLQWQEVEVGDPGPGEVRVRHSFVGLNYIDVYFRTGLYPADMPNGMGLEAAGEVVAVGADVTELKPGDRVAYVAFPLGAYAEERNIAAERCVPLPSWIADDQAAAMMLQGMTVHYLLCSTFPVQRGQTILAHAAAGGVGLILCQWAKHLGARVIGTVGSADKAELARAHGCDHPVLYTDANWVDQVRDLTDGKGVPVVYDSVGAATFDGSLKCLAPRGMMVSFGSASGPVPDFNLSRLQGGSLFITRPGLFHYVASREELMERAMSLFEVVRDGQVRIEIKQRYALKDAAEAHRALEARETTGSTVFEV